MTTRKMVHLLSPFGSPAWMERDQAEKYLAEDDRRYEELAALGGLTAEERAYGPPRIEENR